MFLVMMFHFLVIFVDIYVAGLISPEVQAAIGFVGQLYFFNIIIANAISIGTLVLITRTIGSGNFDKALEIVQQSLILSLFVGSGLTVSGLIFYKEIISFAGFPVQIREISETLLRIYAFSLWPNYVLIVTNAVFRASGDVKKPLVTMFLVSVCNAIGDFVFVFGYFPFPQLGYRGIAIATALSVTIGMVMNIGYFYRFPWRSLFSRQWVISSEIMGKIVTIGWPAALLQLAWNAGTIVLYNILGRLGHANIAALAAFTSGLRIEAVIYLPAFALNMAASVIVGQNLGAKNFDRAEKAGWKISSTGVILMSFAALIIFIWAEWFAAVLAKSPAVLEETTRYLRITMLSEPFLVLSITLAGGLQGAGDTRGTMWIIVFAMWLIRLPLAYFLSIIMKYGAPGVWIAMLVSLVVQGVLMTWRFHKGKWKELKFID
jgi:MATE family multidrug resistance protein